jgi:hypothetical protein
VYDDVFYRNKNRHLLYLKEALWKKVIEQNFRKIDCETSKAGKVKV